MPLHRQRDLIERLLHEVVAPDGRLIVGTFNEERDELRPEASLEEIIAGWGFTSAGRSERPHYHDDRLLYRVVWIDGPQR